MWLFLCESTDGSALWAANRLRARGLTPLLVLTPELLHCSFQWQHRLSSDHPPVTEFRLAGRRTIRGAEVKGVVNRLSGVPQHLFRHFAPADRDYAVQEWTALHISWLAGLRVPVLNQPVMQGLCGAWRHVSEWTWLAAEAGLDTAICRRAAPARLPAPAEGSAPSSAHTVLVVDGCAVDDDLDEQTSRACGRLGTLAGTRLIGVDLDPRTKRFLAASPCPDLRPGGERLIARLHAVLTNHV